MSIDPNKIWNCSRLPTPPSIALRLLNADISEIVETVSADPAITVRILKAANSALYGLRSEVTTVERAVALMGRGAVASIALSFSLTDQNSLSKVGQEMFHQYWLQSIMQGAAAELLAAHSPEVQNSELFLCGMLADLGRLVLIRTVPREYAEIFAEVNAATDGGCSLERAALELDHVEIGIVLSEKWNLPKAVAQSIAHHHDAVPTIQETLDSAGYDARLSYCVKATALASAVGQYICHGQTAEEMQLVRDIAETFFGFSDTQLSQFVYDVRERAESLAQLMEADINDLPEPVEIMELANERLVELTLVTQQAVAQTVAENKVLNRTRQELEDQNLRLQHEITRDDLTGLNTRAFATEFLMKETERALRQHHWVGVVFCDIDHFKHLNDTFGHAFGDTALQEVARAMESAVRKNDVVARYGGEEFIAVLLDSTYESMPLVAERIRASVESLQLVADQGVSVPITISVGGVSVIPSGDAQLFTKEIVAQADAAMYQAKRSGRNRVVTATYRDSATEQATSHDVVCS